MEHFPFIFYNGKFGDDPQAIVLHKTWFWQEGREHQKFIDQRRFADEDPYAPIGSLNWPPAASQGTVGTVFVAPRSASMSPFDGSKPAPICGFALGYSITHQNWTLSLAPGVYSEPVLLKRPMRIVAEQGPAVLGGVRQ